MINFDFNGSLDLSKNRILCTVNLELIFSFSSFPAFAYHAFCLNNCFPYNRYLSIDVGLILRSIGHLPVEHWSTYSRALSSTFMTAFHYFHLSASWKISNEIRLWQHVEFMAWQMVFWSLGTLGRWPKCPVANLVAAKRKCFVCDSQLNALRLAVFLSLSVSLSLSNCLAATDCRQRLPASFPFSFAINSDCPRGESSVCQPEAATDAGAAEAATDAATEANSC